jgi:hypothetical protein
VTPEEIATYARAVLAHVDAQDALRAVDLDAARAAYVLREQAVNTIADLGTTTRSRAFARVLLLARDAQARRAETA